MKRVFPSLEKGDMPKYKENELERELKSDYWALTEPSILKTLEKFPFSRHINSQPSKDKDLFGPNSLHSTHFFS
ncbi:MAG: hypothetical protein HLUCCX10_11840 [Algoriphagus marincola HL-49]|uniref:Uncharacterized protein n=1 Tax=Algoriphagus marincola HL-49 TaxID=1305737 RepID=A0A0P7YGQ0_9BACT|nr:MAG: hypothetical protein HLUCCX10_11840 [Algoriphagus marincola HL-49]